MTNQEIRGAIVGMLLGDGFITKDYSFRITHSESQKEYLFFKTRILQMVQNQSLVPYQINNSGYPGWKVDSRVTPLYKMLKRKVYVNGKKTITEHLLSWLTPLGIAIWFMDDGSSSFKKKNGKIHAVETTLNTYMSKEQNEIIVNYFLETWGLKWGLNRDGDSYRLRMGTNEARKLVKLVEPFVIDSMKYKINKLLI